MRIRGRGHVFDDPATLSRMLELYCAGWSFTRLSELFDCDHTSVLYQVQKNGVWHKREFILPHRRSPAFRNLSIEIKQRIRVLDSTMSLPSLPPAPKPHKYDYVVEEMARPAKTYKDYLKDEALRDPTRGESRAARMERLRGEKKERDAKIARGEIVIFNEGRDFMY